MFRKKCIIFFLFLMKLSKEYLFFRDSIISFGDLSIEITTKRINPTSFLTKDNICWRLGKGLLTQKVTINWISEKAYKKNFLRFKKLKKILELLLSIEINLKVHFYIVLHLLLEDNICLVKWNPNKKKMKRKEKKIL